MNEEIKNTANKSTLLIDLHYFPPISYIKEIVKADTIVLEAHETFQKQTYRNRCEILTANGKEALIVPIIHGSSGFIKDIRIDYSQRWFQIHDRTLRAAYGKSPFFEFVMDDISAVLEAKHPFLWDVNYNMLTLCLEKLTLKKEIIESNAYLDTTELTDFTLDMRGKINPGSNKEVGQNDSKVYHQVFGNEFVRNLSVLDLLFCAVLDSSVILR
ncbi:WbqC family protein [uncultured Cytophaga sp.]|uniref:WbqC family protein n=1 Tax=uncultured Cytophaga sp. TaxID=160238 RepID=UPI002629E693|nr:WbqC family protein [uncultured Cytophaga sp.]